MGWLILLLLLAFGVCWRHALSQILFVLAFFARRASISAAFFPRSSSCLFFSSFLILRRWKNQAPANCVLVFSFSDRSASRSFFMASHPSLRRLERNRISRSRSSSSCSMSWLWPATTSTSALVVQAKVNGPEMPMIGLMFRQCSPRSTFP
jgi:hypothetical protein